MRMSRAALLPLLLLVTSCSSVSPASHIISPTDSGNGVGFHDASANTPYTFGGLIICMDGPGRAVIDKVTPMDPTGGLTVDAFVAVPNPVQFATSSSGSTEGSIDQLSQQIGAGGAVVDHECTPTLSRSEKMLYVQVSKASGKTASDTGLFIDYTSGGQKFTVPVPWFQILCAPGDTSTYCE